MKGPRIGSDFYKKHTRSQAFCRNNTGITLTYLLAQAVEQGYFFKGYRWEPVRAAHRLQGLDTH